MISGINHITFAVKDLTKSITFYQKILGCNLIATWRDGAHLLAGDLWICLSGDNHAMNAESKHYSHIAFSVIPDHFNQLKSCLLENNIPTWKENISEGESLYILDPDFHKLEIHYSSLSNRLTAMRDKPYQSQLIFKDIDVE